MQGFTVAKETKSNQEELLRILTKGMVTIPKSWRTALGFKEGERIRAIKKDCQIILESIEQKAPYRIYTQQELNQFIKDDSLPSVLRKKVEKKLDKAYG